MAVVCPKCGHSNRVDAKFCISCRTSISQPMSPAGKGLSWTVGNVILGVLCLIYLINPTAGVLELIPDNLPIVGNLDEVGAVMGMMMVLNNLGWITFQRR